MSATFPVSTAAWSEPPTSLLALTRLYWSFDEATATWTLTPTASLEFGRLADQGDGTTFALQKLADIPGDAATKRVSCPAVVIQALSPTFRVH